MNFPHFSTLVSLTKRCSVDRAEWTISDLIDFEYYLEGDERVLREQPAARKVLAQRDRALYLEHPSVSAAAVQPASATKGLGGFAAAVPHTPAHRRISLRNWLIARRNAEDPRFAPLLPGATFASAQRLGTLALAAGGFFVGIGVASALLSYDGHRPISVPFYVFWLVLVQFLFAGAAVWAWTTRTLRRDDGANAWLLNQVMRPLLNRAARWLQRQRLDRATTDIRDRAQATQGLLKSQYAIYSTVAHFPLLIPLQVFGVAFNVGVILTTIVLEWFTDLAFGWSTALIAHPQTIHDLARAIAFPWSGLFGEGVGYPTLEQIAGSRVYLEQWASATPAFHPDPEHLRSWRWFLVLAVFTYGLLPRLIFLGLSGLLQRLALARLAFTHGRSQALYARMLTPILDTSAAVMTPGPEMPIPAPLLPHSRRSGLVGPLPGASTQPLSSVRPWREKPLVEKASFAQGGLDSPPLVADVTPVAKPELVNAPPPPLEPVREPEPVIEIKPLIASAPVAELKLEPVVEPEPLPLVIEPEPIVELVIEPEAESVAISQPAPAAKVVPPPLPLLESEPIVELEPEPVAEPAPVIAPEPILTLEPESLPTQCVAPEPMPEPEPLLVPSAESASTPERLPESEPEPELPLFVIPPAAAESATCFAPDACLLLVHVDVDDVLEAEDRPRLEHLLLQLTGWRVAAYATFGAGSAMTVKALEILDHGQWQAPPPRIAVLQDGSQPPITENLLFLRDLRAAAGTQAQMLLALIGDPQDDDRLPPLRAFDYTDWQRKLDQMADPYLRLEMLATPSEDGDM